MKSKRPCRVSMFSEIEQKETLKEGNLAIFLDNELLSIYNKNHIPMEQWVLEKMLNDAYEEGTKSVSNDIKEILGI